MRVIGGKNMNNPIRISFLANDFWWVAIKACRVGWVTGNEQFSKYDRKGLYVFNILQNQPTEVS